jgi:hypothetical protein
MANVLELYNRFKGGGKGGKMVYPLENQSDYLGKITFTPVVETGIEVPNLNLLDLKDGAIGKGIEVLQDTGRDVIDFAKRYLNGGDTVVSADGQQEATKGVADTFTKSAFFGAASGETTVGNSVGGNDAEAKLTLDTDSRISLYLPRAIQIQDTVSYDNAFQLGLIGGAIEKGLSPGGGGAVSAVVGTVAGEVSGFANSMLGSSIGGGAGLSKQAGGILAGKIAARIPRIGDVAGGSVRGATRLTTNPNTRALFKDVPIRNFSFAFQLVPTSRAEARIIEKIIKTFRKELYPEALQAGGVNVGYQFPNRFLIKVKYNNTDIAGIRFLPVYMQSFNATYNSATGGMHNDGRFTAVDISMAFTETRAIAKADVREGY